MKLRLISEDYSKFLSESLSVMLQEGFLCDLTVYINTIDVKHQIKIHKLIISAVSPWFKSLVIDSDHIMIQGNHVC